MGEQSVQFSPFKQLASPTIVVGELDEVLCHSLAGIGVKLFSSCAVDPRQFRFIGHGIQSEECQEGPELRAFVGGECLAARGKTSESTPPIGDEDEEETHNDEKSRGGKREWFKPDAFVCPSLFDSCDQLSYSRGKGRIALYCRDHRQIEDQRGARQSRRGVELEALLQNIESAGDLSGFDCFVSSLGEQRPKSIADVRIRRAEYTKQSRKTAVGSRYPSSGIVHRNKPFERIGEPCGGRSGNVLLNVRARKQLQRLDRVRLGFHAADHKAQQDTVQVLARGGGKGCKRSGPTSNIVGCELLLVHAEVQKSHKLTDLFGLAVSEVGKRLTESLQISKITLGVDAAESVNQVLDTQFRVKVGDCGAQLGREFHAVCNRDLPQAHPEVRRSDSTAQHFSHDGRVVSKDMRSCGNDSVPSPRIVQQHGNRRFECGMERFMLLGRTEHKGSQLCDSRRGAVIVRRSALEQDVERFGARQQHRPIFVADLTCTVFAQSTVRTGQCEPLDGDSVLSIGREWPDNGADEPVYNYGEGSYPRKAQRRLASYNKLYPPRGKLLQRASQGRSDLLIFLIGSSINPSGSSRQDALHKCVSCIVPKQKSSEGSER